MKLKRNICFCIFCLFKEYQMQHKILDLVFKKGLVSNRNEIPQTILWILKKPLVIIITDEKYFTVDQVSNSRIDSILADMEISTNRSCQDLQTWPGQKILWILKKPLVIKIMDEKYFTVDQVSNSRIDSILADMEISTNRSCQDLQTWPGRKILWILKKPLVIINMDEKYFTVDQISSSRIDRLVSNKHNADVQDNIKTVSKIADHYVWASCTW